MDDFIDRKHGRKKVVYDLPQLEPILKDTYGVIVYQEQVMQIARSLAGYSLGGADLLRRAMGKKDPAVMAKEKDKFLDGAKEQGVNRKKAEAIFDLMAKFAEYGFNKSHSAAYALVAYQTAYLKAHYPVEFMAALLTEDMGNTDKVIKNISDCRDMGIEVLPPDINSSDLSFRVFGNSIRFGLGAVKNVGEGAIEAIIDARERGLSRTSSISASGWTCAGSTSGWSNRSSSAALSIPPARGGPLMAALDDATNLGQRIQQERDSAQVSLFGTAEIVKANGNGGATLPDLPEWDDKLLLGFEKEAIGFFITGHPLGRYVADMKRFATADCASLADLPDKSDVRICGIVAGLKESITKKGDRMGFVTLEDLTGSVEVIVFPEIYAKAVEHLKSEEPLVVSGNVDIGEKSTKIKATDVVPLCDVTEKETKRVCLTLKTSGLEREALEALKGVIGRHRGECRVCLRFELPERLAVTVNLPVSYAVAAREDLSLEVEGLLGYNAVSFE